MFHYVNKWLWTVGGIVPPFCVEVVLRDGRRFYLHSVTTRDRESRTGVIQIWDMRALEPRDLDALKSRLNEITDVERLSATRELHPKLDWANVYLHEDDVMYCVEWHDRLWPEEQRPRIGF